MHTLPQFELNKRNLSLNKHSDPYSACVCWAQITCRTPCQGLPHTWFHSTFKTTPRNAIISFSRAGKLRPQVCVLTMDTQLISGKLGFEFQSTDSKGTVLPSLFLRDWKKTKALSANTISPPPFALHGGLEVRVYQIQICPFSSQAPSCLDEVLWISPTKALPMADRPGRVSSKHQEHWVGPRSVVCCLLWGHGYFTLDLNWEIKTRLFLDHHPLWRWRGLHLRRRKAFLHPCGCLLQEAGGSGD